MKRKCKLLRYYSELKHIERQQPEAIISVKEVIARLHEIKIDLETENTKQKEIVQLVKSKRAIKQ